MTKFLLRRHLASLRDKVSIPQVFSKARYEASASPVEGEVAAKLAQLDDGKLGVFGMNESGYALTNPLISDCVHGLLLGPTGCGKTVLARRLVESFAHEVWILSDHSETDYDLIGSVTRVISAFGPGGYEFLEREVRQRRDDRGGHQVLLVVDGMHRFQAEAKWQPLFVEIARRGRELGVQLLVIGQLLSDVPFEIWQNCQFRVSIGALPSEAAAIGAVADLREEPGVLAASAVRLGKSFAFWFLPRDLYEKSSSAWAEEDNPLLRSSSLPRSIPYEEFVPSHQTPSDQRSAEELVGLQDLHGHQLGSRDQPRIERYSRIL